MAVQRDLGSADLSSGTVEALLRLADAVGNATTLGEIYEAALDGIERALHIGRAAILLFEADGVMRFQAWRSLSPEYRTAIEGRVPWAFDETAPRPALVPDVHADDRFCAHGAIFDRERIAALACFPLLSGHRAIGEFVLYCAEPHVFSPGEVSLAFTIGHQIGFAVERTRSELEGKAAHQRLLFALDAAQMGTWEWDLRTGNVRWSDNLERIHGLPPGSFDGQFASYEREIHPDDRDRVFASLQRALLEGAVHDVEYRVVAPDGTVRWMHGKGCMERDADGQPVRMSGVCMDISLRRRTELEMESALRQEAATRDRLTVLTTGSRQLLTTLDAVSVIDQVLSLARQVVAANGYAVWRRVGDVWKVAASDGLSEEFTVSTVKDNPNTRFRQPVVAEDVMATELLESRRSVYEREGIRSLVTVPLIVRGDLAGSIVFYYRSVHRPSEGELGVAFALAQLAAVAVSNAELYAEQQTLRAAAQQSAERAAFLAEASARVSSLDDQTNLTRVAEIAVPRLGDWCAVDLLDEHGAIRRMAIAHADPAKAAVVREYRARHPPLLDEGRGVGRVIRTGVPELYSDVQQSHLVAVARDDQELRMLEGLEVQSAMIVPLKTGAGAFGTMTFVSTNATRRYGQGDIDFAAELARRVAYAVENTRLYREAQDASRLKDEFLATLSHELRTPLNVMLGRARMLRHGATTEPVQAAASAIERNGATLARLVEDLLDLSRITLGRLRLEFGPVNVADVIDAAVQGVLPAATAKSVALEVDVDRSAPSLTGDPTRLQQVVWNLLINAVKFTPSGGRVTLRLTAEPSDVVLDVSDTGSGIDPAFLPHVFEMFRQARPVVERNYGGLGIGLSIVRRLVELHGGTVAAHSEGPGRGATFTVRLPRATEASRPISD